MAAERISVVAEHFAVRGRGFIAEDDGKYNEALPLWRAAETVKAKLWRSINRCDLLGISLDPEGIGVLRSGAAALARFG